MIQNIFTFENKCFNLKKKIFVENMLLLQNRTTFVLKKCFFFQTRIYILLQKISSYSKIRITDYRVFKARKIVLLL